MTTFCLTGELCLGSESAFIHRTVDRSQSAHSMKNAHADIYLSQCRRNIRAAERRKIELTSRDAATGCQQTRHRHLAGLNCGELSKSGLRESQAAHCRWFDRTFIHSMVGWANGLSAQRSN